VFSLADDVERRGAVSYLLQYATRRPAAAGRRRTRAHVDECTPLNLPAFDGGAHVRVFVEDTAGRKRRLRRTPPVPRLRLCVADCVNTVHLDFSVASAELRENALFKIDTLLGALSRFRDGLVAEAELYARREAQTRTTRF
jgi:hypothetical protein